MKLANMITCSCDDFYLKLQLKNYYFPDTQINVCARERWMRKIIVCSWYGNRFMNFNFFFVNFHVKLRPHLEYSDVFIL